MSCKSYKVAGIFLLLSQMFERITFYSLVANFVYTLNSSPLKWTFRNAMNATFILSGFSYVATMFGGLLADTVFKKSTTVLVGYMLYSVFVGYPLVFMKSMAVVNYTMKLPSFCVPNETKNSDGNINMFSEPCSNIIIPVTFVCAIGSGLIKSVIASIGADIAVQKWSNPSTFFTLYYWTINFGSLIAYSTMAFVQQNYSRFYGFLIPGIILVISFCFFILGLPYYVDVKKAPKSTINLVFNIYREAFKKYVNRKSSLLERIKKVFRIKSNLAAVSESINYEKNSLSKTSKIGNGECSSDSEMESEDGSTIIETTVTESYADILFLDRTKIRFGGTFLEEDVENVRDFTHVFITLVHMIPYWILYFQMETTYSQQGLHLNLHSDNSNNFSIPACWLSMIDILIIMCILPILIKFIYPCLRNKNLYPNNYIRILIGMILAILSVIIAGIIECQIDKDFSQIYQKIGGSYFNASNLSVFSQIPQYLIMGLSESQAVVAGLEISCTQVPSSMQGLTNGLFWFFSGIGSFVGTGFLLFFNFYKDGEKNLYPNRNAYIYFLILSSIQVVGILCFIPMILKMRKIEKEKRFSVISSLTNSI